MIWLCALLAAGCSQKRAEPVVKSGRDSTNIADTTSLPTGQPLLSYERRQGKALYGKYCAVCHGEEGKGDGFNAYNLDPKPRDFTDPILMDAMTDQRLTQTIDGGGRSVNKSIQMPSWGGRMTKDEIRFVVAYVRMFAPAK